MNLGIMDYIILLIILLGGVVGFKEGVLKKLTSFIGLIAVIIASFMLKKYLSVIFYENLPFFNLWGIFKGLQVINIVFYELLAFLIIASVLTIVYRILLGLTGLLEKLLKATVILSIPSKILGFIVGLVENYMWIYLCLFILTLPVINFQEVRKSEVAQYMLNNTPVVSKYANKTLDIYHEIYKMIDERKDKTNEEFNEEALDYMLDKDFITVKSVKKLLRKNKIDIDDDSFLKKYE